MSTKFNFSGKRVLVTGGAKGFGRGIVVKFLEAGATVIALDRDAIALAQLKADHPPVVTAVADLSDWEASKRVVEGLGPIHHLVNNAGIPELAKFQDITGANVDRIFGVNFKPLINMGQVMAKSLESAGISGGTIVNVSSIMDSRAIAGGGLYCCTKAAVTMLTKVMALELSPQGIRVNAVRPTLMATELLAEESPLSKEVGGAILEFCLSRQINKRLLSVDEAAATILYLSSDASEMVNGSDILVDGGVYTN